MHITILIINNFYPPEFHDKLNNITVFFTSLGFVFFFVYAEERSDISLTQIFNSELLISDPNDCPTDKSTLKEKNDQNCDN